MLDTIPVDDMALDLIEKAYESHMSIDEDGEPVLVGEFDIYRLLDFWSGHDPSLNETISDNKEFLPNGTFSQKDVIIALISEVRRLRELYESDM